MRSVLGNAPNGDLVHAAGVFGGHVTHQVRGKDRYFDHILVSPHWTVLETGVDHDVRSDGTSDHSLVWADIRPQGPRYRKTHGSSSTSSSAAGSTSPGVAESMHCVPRTLYPLTASQPSALASRIA